MSTPKILTIDDEVEFTHLIDSYLSPRGYKVFVANEGVTGLAIAKREKPDVCLIDMKMPGMHGDEVMKEIFALNPKAKVIMITASEGEGKMRSDLVEMGAFTCFDKPLTSLKDLEREINKALKS